MAGRLHGVWRGFPFPLIFKCMEDGEFSFDGADLVQCSAFDGWRWDNK
jgi:hypothetical protein